MTDRKRRVESIRKIVDKEAERVNSLTIEEQITLLEEEFNTVFEYR